MKNFIAIALTAPFCLHAICTDTCQTGSTLNPYFSIGGGVVFPSRNSSSRGNTNAVLYPSSQVTSLFLLPNLKWNNKYETGFEVNAIVGHSLSCNLNGDIEFVYQNFERSLSGSYTYLEINAATREEFIRQANNPLTLAKTRANLYSGFSNLSYNFNNCTSWTPYIGAGFGVAWLQSKSTIHKGILMIDQPSVIETAPTIEKSPSLAGTAFAWQVKAGITYSAFKKCSLNLSYRLLGTTRFQSRVTTITTNPGTEGESYFTAPQADIYGLLNHSVNLTLQYNF